MKEPRKHYSGREKVAVLRRHFLEKEAISKLCDELGLRPTVFYCWGLGRPNGRAGTGICGDNGGYKNFLLAAPETGGAIFVFTNGDAGARVYDRVVRHATEHDHSALFWL